MTRSWIAVLGLSVCASVASAQQGPPVAGAATVAHNTFVLTGCLVRTGAEPNVRFELKDATPVGQAPSADAAVAPVGTSGQKLTYRLKPKSPITETGVPDERLKMFVGQRVQVTVQAEEGTPAPAAKLPATGAAAPQEPVMSELSVAEIQASTGTCS